MLPPSGVDRQGINIYKHTTDHRVYVMWFFVISELLLDCFVSLSIVMCYWVNVSQNLSVLTCVCVCLN